MMISRALLGALSISALVLGGCAGGGHTPDLAAIYQRAASVPDEQRVPVIVIPGILGSKLHQASTGRVAWGAFTKDFADPGTPDGLRLLALPLEKGVPLRQIKDDVTPNGALDRVDANLLGFPISVRAYAEVLQTLGVGGFVDKTIAQAGLTPNYGGEHYTCYQFDYDWRRDISETASALFQLTKAASDYATELRGTGERVRVDIVAHSMGGMVARYMLRYGSTPLPLDGSMPEITWAGAEYVDRVVIVGTPNAGSAEAIKQLANGFVTGPFLPEYPGELLGTHPAIYQLMPRERHGVLFDAETGERLEGLYDVEFWDRMGWGLLTKNNDRKLRQLMPEVESAEERRAIARDQVEKSLALAQQLQEAIDRPAPAKPDHLEMTLIAGDSEDTLVAVDVDTRTGRIRDREEGPGDGTVARYSAVMDERTGGEWSYGLKSPIPWDHIVFMFEDHLGLTKSPEFSDNVLFHLLEKPRK